MNKEVTSSVNTPFNRFEITETQDSEGNTLFVEVEHYQGRSQSTKFECFSTMLEAQAMISDAVKDEAVDQLMAIFRAHESEIEPYYGEQVDAILESSYEKLAKSILEHFNQE